MRWLSRYSYLVSLFPEKIVRDLDLNLEFRRREIASYTPYLRDGRHNGLLLSNVSREVGRQSMIELTGSDDRVRRDETLLWTGPASSPSKSGTQC